MAVNRQVVKKSRLLRLLVKAGKDRRQMVRQLCHAPYINPPGGRTATAADDLICGFSWDCTKQGFEYWNTLHNELLACQ